MTFNAGSRRLRSLDDRSAELGSSRCELPKSAVLPYASGVGGLSRRLLNRCSCDPEPHHSLADPDAA